LLEDRNFSAVNLLKTAPDDQGIVTKKNSGIYQVQVDDRSIACSLSSRLRKELVYSPAGSKGRGRRVREVKTLDHADPVAVGDRVRFTEVQNGSGTIVEVLPRRNRLSRRAAGKFDPAHPFEQVIVANLDQVVPVFAAADPAPRWNLLDRYLVSAESAGLPALICITKVDLAQDQDASTETELGEAVEDYRRTGYPVVLASAITGEGIDELRQALAGRTSAFLGKSGVGKSSLLNALQPGLGLRVNEISQATGKGKHTTTHLEMFPLEPEGYVVDTPGIREFGLWEVDEDDLALYFPEMRPFVGRCKFGLDCRHDEEPGCAIRKAVMGGQISPRRYQSYLRLRE
jgi:ribosome biogenesis GTPase / thiamine phosphate phosphatase